MRELGEYLKQMRQAKGLSVEDVASATKISVAYITALEEGDFEKLPTDIYVRGFIKSYGQLLGADLDELNSRYETEKPKPKARRIFSGKPKEAPPYEPPIPKSKIGKKRVLPRKITLSGSNIIIIIVIIVVAIAVIKIFIGKKPPAGPPITNVTDILEKDTTGDKNGRLTVSLTETDLTQEIRLELSEINPAWALGRADSLTLAVVARQQTWILIETDYKRAFKGDIERGDTMTFRAKNAFFITMGNPNVMHLMINGFDLSEWPERSYPMDLDINRANVLQLLEGVEIVSLPRPPRPNIIGAPPEEIDSLLQPPPIRTRELGLREDSRSTLENDTPPNEGPE